MLTDEQRRAFHDDGFVALAGRGRRRRRGAHARADLAPPRAQRRGARRPVDLAAAPGQRAAPDQPVRPRPSRPPVFIGALDDLFGAGVWRTPGQLGPGAGDLPDPGPWDVPHRPWHLDHPLPTSQPEGSICGRQRVPVRRRRRAARAVAPSWCAAPRGTSSGSSSGLGRPPARRSSGAPRSTPAIPGSRRSATPTDTEDRVPRFTAVTDVDGDPHPGRRAHGPRRRRRGVPPVADPQHRPERRATGPG